MGWGGGGGLLWVRGLQDVQVWAEMRLGRERAAAMAAAGFQRDGGNMAVMWCGEVRVFAQKWWEEGNVVGRGIAGSGRGLKTIDNGKKGQGLHEDTRGQWTSVGQLHGSQLFGVLWVKCTRHRMPRPSPNHPRNRNPAPRRLRHQLGWVLPRQTPPAEIGRLAPFCAGNGRFFVLYEVGVLARRQ